jgi:hypothetical protein
MKKRTQSFTAAALLPLALLVTACASSKSDPALATLPFEGLSMTAMVEGVPGGVFVDSSETKATVTAINSKKREVTLTDVNGQTLTAQVGPEVVNFDQIEEGDTVTVSVIQTLAIYLADAEISEPDSSASMATAAAKGEKPGMVVAHGSQTTATVTAIDLENQAATLQFADGSSETFPVRKDIDLSKYEVGEKVVFEEGVILSITVSN